jgi:hypothetical protein
VRIVNQLGWHTPTQGGHEATDVKFIGEKGGGGRPTRQAWSKTGSEFPRPVTAPARWNSPFFSLAALRGTQTETFTIVR